MTELALRAQSAVSQGAESAANFFENLSFVFPRFLFRRFEPAPSIFYLTDRFDELNRALEKHKYPQEVLNATLAHAAKNYQLESIALLMQHGADLPAVWHHVVNFALQAPNDRCLRKVIELRGSQSPELLSPILESATRQNRIDLMRALIMSGARFSAKFMEQLETIRCISPGISAFVRLGDSILNADKSLIPMKELDRICGGSGARIRKSDAFNHHDNWSSSNFIAVSLHAAFVASAFFPDNPASQTKAFQMLVQSDIRKIENTTGLSWKKYREMEDARLTQVDNFNDVITEFYECVALPLTIAHFGEIQNTQLIKEAAAIFLLKNKTTLDFGALNESWHKAGNQLSDRLRPCRVIGRWIPLFPGMVELGNSITAVDLCSSEMLVSESEQMDHCVGRGSYAQRCLDGNCHIISIKQHGYSIATIQLAKSPNGNLFDQGGIGWAQVQFKGIKNQAPPHLAKEAWERFCEKVSEKEITLSKNHGATADPKNTLVATELEKLIGYNVLEIETMLPPILEHYANRVRVQRNSSTVSLIGSTDMNKIQEQIIETFEMIIEQSKKSVRKEPIQIDPNRIFEEMLDALDLI